MTDTSLHFGEWAPSLHELSDAEFLQAVRWNAGAPQPMANAARRGDVARFSRFLAARRCAVRKGVTGKRVTRPFAARPALWSRPSFEDSLRSAELIAAYEAFGCEPRRPRGKKAARHYRAAKARRQGDGSNGRDPARDGNWFEAEARLAEWLDAVHPAAPLQPFELVVLLEVLPALGRELSPPLRWAVWRAAFSAGLKLSVDLEAPLSDVPHDVRAIVSGELPFELGVLFAGVKGAGRLRRRGGKSLARELLDATDVDGTPGAEYLERLPQWLAGFVRARQWAAAFKERLWNGEAEERFLALLRVVASMCRGDGKLALSNGVPTETLPILTTAAASGLRKSSRPMRLLADIGEDVRKRRRGKRPKFARPLKKGKAKQAARRTRGGRPAAQSDWARLACLRSDWSADADLLVVAHDGEIPRIDLSAWGVPLLKGDWAIDVTVDREPLRPAGDWECTCWFSDRDVDFIELQQRMKGGVLIDRQLALSRTSHFACLTDCIHRAVGKRISCRSRFAAADGAACEADRDTRELRIRRGKTIARCYPLSLPFDRVHSAAGSFERAADDSLVLSQTAFGGLIAPVVLDWGPGRRKQRAEWCALTVAEDGRPLGSEDAGGFRLRVGELHLVLYRSLTPSVPGRSLLGLHTRNETLIGRFTAAGDVDPILLVE